MKKAVIFLLILSLCACSAHGKAAEPDLLTYEECYNNIAATLASGSGAYSASFDGDKTILVVLRAEDTFWRVAYGISVESQEQIDAWKDLTQSLQLMNQKYRQYCKEHGCDDMNIDIEAHEEYNGEDRLYFAMHNYSVTYDFAAEVKK